MISIEKILSTLKILFLCWDDFGKDRTEQVLKENICDGVPQ